jgi:adenylate cyclase class 2
MKHRHETEIKLPVKNLRAAKRRLKDLGFVEVTPRRFESNHLFDFEDEHLRQARCLLRLRFVGRQGVLTYKGTPLSARRYKIRREIETGLEDGHALREILESLELRETFYYEKYRTTFAPRGKSRVSEATVAVLDETPIGNFLELEGPERWIDETARQLGYKPEDYITRSYVTLYRRWCEQRGIKPKAMFFSVRKS